MSRILDNFYLSSQYDARNESYIQTNKISTVIIAALNAFSHVDGVKYAKLPLLDVRLFPIIFYLPEAFEAIDTGMKDGLSVLVHCRFGVSRSATIVIAYLMLKQKLDLEAALKHVKKIRNVVNPNPGFIYQLKRFERILIEYENQKQNLLKEVEDYKLLKKLINKDMIYFRLLIFLIIMSIILGIVYLIIF